jgi:hypothetical protein
VQIAALFKLAGFGDDPRVGMLGIQYVVLNARINAGLTS